jgi:hypothetical protein
MNLFGIGSIIESVGKVAGDLVTSDKERLELELEGRKLDQAIDLAQIDVNKKEAEHFSVFVAGWRPGAAWVCVAGLAWHYILQPVVVFFAVLYGYQLPPLPVFDMDALMTLLFGLLGLGGFRAIEKIQGVAR